MVNLGNITFNQLQQRSDTEVLRNAQRFIPAKRYRAFGQTAKHENYRLKSICTQNVLIAKVRL